MDTQTVRHALISIILFSMLPLVVFGQATDEICEAFLDDVFTQLGTNCAGLEGDEICFGYGELLPSLNVNNELLVDDEALTFITEDGQVTRTSLDSGDVYLENISGIPFQFLSDLDNQVDNGAGATWSIGWLRIQSDLPVQLDQNILIGLFGDASISNDVLSDNAFVPETSISVELDNSAIFNFPPGYPSASFEDFAAVDTVTGIYNADAISPDGQWVRVDIPHETDFGTVLASWVMVDDIQTSDDLSTLTVLGESDFAPWQRMSFDASSQEPPCNNAPPAGIMIQTPEGIVVELTINDSRIRLTGTLYADMPNVNTLRFTILSGLAEVIAGEGGTTILVVIGEQLTCTQVASSEEGSENRLNSCVAFPDSDENNENIPSTFVDLIDTSRFEYLDNLPDNILNIVLPRIIISRASGIGNANPIITIIPPEQAERIRELCQNTEFSIRICDFLR